MPPLPTIADVYRAQVLWTNPGVSLRPINTLHFRSATGTVEDLATDLAANVVALMFAGLSNQFEQTSFIITPLDGFSAGTEFPGAGFSGSGSAEYSPASAIVISFRTAQRGSRGRGRIYYGPIGEGQMTDGTISPAAATTIADAWHDFHLAMAAESSAWESVVASYVHSDAHVITTTRCDIALGTQRRRQDVIAGR